MTDAAKDDEFGKSDTKVVKMRDIKPTFALSSYKGSILYLGNPWPDDFNRAVKEYERLSQYKATKDLDNSQIDVDTRTRLTSSATAGSLEELASSSKLVNLYQIVPGFAQDGLVVLGGIGGRVFNEDDQRDFENATALLKKFQDNTKNLLNYVKKVVVQKKNVGSSDKDQEREAEKYEELAEMGVQLAGERYILLEDILDKDNVLTVRGVFDRDHENHWPKVKDRGIFNHKLSNDKFLRIAYFGGYNYGSEEKAIVPHALTTVDQPTESDLYAFLKENDFDVLVFSGDSKVLEKAIEKVNKQVRVRKGSWPIKYLRHSEPKIKNKLIIVSNTTSTIYNSDFYADGHNLIMQGINYKDDRMLLIKPSTKHLGVTVITTPKNRAVHDIKDPLSKWDHLCEVVDEFVYADGDKKSPDLFTGEVGITSVLRQAVENAEHLVTNKKMRDTVRQCTVTFVKYGIAATLGAAAAALALSALTENKSDSGLDAKVRVLETENKKREETLKEQDEIINEYERLVQEYIASKSK